jgi:hypothetical protein
MCLVEVEGSPKPVSNLALRSIPLVDCLCVADRFMCNFSAPRPQGDHQVRENPHCQRVSFLFRVLAIRWCRLARACASTFD